MEECIFCKIRDKKIPADFEYESGHVMAFPDISPSADVHILIVPKEHILTFTDLNENHIQIVGEMIRVAHKLVNDKNVGDGYRIVFNGGKFQHVKHLHMHLLGGELKKQI
ncbi:HIT domain-containing protein [Candidatus Microgenomates bacterium]|nr:HIT domain-containing protein [Candidatus Microgenomates bacterium]